MADSACSGVQSGLQRIKDDTPVQLDNQFAVDDKPFERDVHQRRHNFGEKAAQRLSGFSLSSTAPPSLKAKQRKPSHFGSNCHPPGSFGSPSADLASIGAPPSRKENK